MARPRRTNANVRGTTREAIAAAKRGIKGPAGKRQGGAETGGGGGGGAKVRFPGFPGLGGNR